MSKLTNYLNDHDVKNPNAPFIFLGGTCNEDPWRNQLISKLKVSYFNPVVANWNEQAKALEDMLKPKAAALVFVITPNQKGFYSIAELTNAANANEQKVIVQFLENEDEIFDEDHRKSNEATIDLIKNNECVHVVEGDLQDLADYLNQSFQ